MQSSQTIITANDVKNLLERPFHIIIPTFQNYTDKEKIELINTVKLMGPFYQKRMIEAIFPYCTDKEKSPLIQLVLDMYYTDKANMIQVIFKHCTTDEQKWDCIKALEISNEYIQRSDAMNQLLNNATQEQREFIARTAFDYQSLLFTSGEIDKKKENLNAEESKENIEPQKPMDQDIAPQEGQIDPLDQVGIFSKLQITILNAINDLKSKDKTYKEIRDEKKSLLITALESLTTTLEGNDRIKSMIEVLTYIEGDSLTSQDVSDICKEQITDLEKILKEMKRFDDGQSFAARLDLEPKKYKNLIKPLAQKKYEDDCVGDFFRS